MISWFFEGLFYYIALLAFIAGLALYGVSILPSCCRLLLLTH